MGVLRTTEFWADALERAVSTAAQSVLVVLGLSNDGFELTNLNFSFELAAQAAILGFVASLLKGIAAAQFGDKESASLIE